MNFRLPHLGKSLALLGFAFSLGSLHAANLLVPTAATGVQLYCGNAATYTMGVKLVSGTTSTVVTIATPLPAGMVITPASVTVASSTVAQNFTLSAPVCAGVSGAVTFTL